jgi:formyltetrahydrofolate deformylase
MSFEINEEMIPSLTELLESVKEVFKMDLFLRKYNQNKKVLILCSKQPHCLIHLLEKKRQGAISFEIPCIISNHNDLKNIATYHNIPFHHLPITKEIKQEQEAQIEKFINEHKVDYIVLARYMQILSPKFCNQHEGKIINIHHSFLPGFKGANPYKQAFERGVKIIGATSHFVTEDLDEGPIICQETIRVHHHHTVDELTRFGADIEALVLARALKYVIEDKVFIDLKKTVVFK